MGDFDYYNTYSCCCLAGIDMGIITSINNIITIINISYMDNEFKTFNEKPIYLGPAVLFACFDTCSAFFHKRNKNSELSLLQDISDERLNVQIAV